MHDHRRTPVWPKRSENSFSSVCAIMLRVIALRSKAVNISWLLVDSGSVPYWLLLWAMLQLNSWIDVQRVQKVQAGRKGFVSSDEVATALCCCCQAVDAAVLVGPVWLQAMLRVNNWVEMSTMVGVPQPHLLSAKLVQIKARPEPQHVLGSVARSML